MSASVEIDARGEDLEIKRVEYAEGQVEMRIGRLFENKLTIRFATDDLRQIVSEAAGLLPVDDLTCALLDNVGGDRLGELIALLQEALTPPAVAS